MVLVLDATRRCPLHPSNKRRAETGHLQGLRVIAQRRIKALPCPYCTVQSIGSALPVGLASRRGIVVRCELVD